MTENYQKPHEPLAAYYESDEVKPDYLKQLFDTSSQDYDRVLKYAFFGTGAAYRRRTIQSAGLHPGMRVLDVACGTGGVLQEVLKTVPAEQLTGVDPSEGMLAAARSKLPGVTFYEGTAEALPLEDKSIDLVTMGYALRHMRSFDEAFREFFRVLKPGGQVLILELSRPRSRVGYALTKFYLKYYVPLVALLLCRNRSAPRMMRYFWDSIDACVEREVILERMADAGFHACRNDCELGIFSAFSGTRPEIIA